MRSSFSRWPCSLPRQVATLAFFSFVLGALIVTTSLYSPRKTFDRLLISLKHDHLLRVPQYDYSRCVDKHCLITPPRDVDFEAALRNLTDLIPDEARVEQLLSPIDYSEGTSMLRDLAIRTRVFAALFGAWESLHIAGTMASGDVLIRQNIIERIRHNPSEGADEAIRRYDTVRSFLNLFSRHLFPWTARHSPDHMLLHASFNTGGRGIVVTVGDHQAAYVLTSIRTFREFGCDLPVEVFFLGDEDLHEDSRAALKEIPGVTTRDLSEMVYDDGWTLKGIVESAYVLRGLILELTMAASGWAAKPMAMLLSSFREVILIDADVLFFDDPTDLFSDPDYLQFGALFFRDRLFAPTDHADFISKSLPWPLSQNILQSNRWWSGTSHHMQESGVVVVDKWRHFVALLLTTRLNGPDREGDETLGKKGVYQMMHGDKETFWLSWEMAGDTDYAFFDGRAGQIGVVTQSSTASGQDSKKEMCGKQLLHTSRDGRPLWFNGWIATDKHKENHLSSFQDFEGFVVEPRETSRWDLPYWNGWNVREGNIMCLASDGYVPLSSEERQTVELILETAKKVVASGV